MKRLIILLTMFVAFSGTWAGDSGDYKYVSNVKVLVISSVHKGYNTQYSQQYVDMKLYKTEFWGERHYYLKYEGKYVRVLRNSYTTWGDNKIDVRGYNGIVCLYSYYYQTEKVTKEANGFLNY